ncbi:hypothetical protein OF83DRAFT_1017821, partial [Amylostereum chailletii]
FVLVDRTGIHQIGVRPCQCHSASLVTEQLLDMRMYPATQSLPRTAFTYNFLDDAMLENLECRSNSNSIMRRLQRATNMAF